MVSDLNSRDELTKSIPSNIEAEQAVLGSLLIDPDAIIKVASFLRPEDFYRERHSWLYESMLALNERREPLDFVTLVDELERREQLEEIGGPAYITDLMGNTPTALYVDHYARIVERTALLRRLISAAGKIAEMAYDESQETDQVIERAEQIIFGISESRIHRDLMPIHSVMQDVVNRLDFLSRNQDTLMGVPTGFHSLDQMLGGFQQSDLIIIAARPGMGKCVSADTKLIDPQTGALETIETLVENRRARLLTIGRDFKLHQGEASDFVDDGIKPLYRVRTALGREIKTTLSHPFLTVEGWRPLQELQAGDHVGLPRVIPIFGNRDAPKHEAKLLAYLLADGCVTGVAPQFTNKNRRLRDDFIEAAQCFPGVRSRVYDSGGRRTPTVHIYGDLDFIHAGREKFATKLRTLVDDSPFSTAEVAHELDVSVPLVRGWMSAQYVPSAPTFQQLSTILDVAETDLIPDSLASISRNSQNTLTIWLQEQGLWGKTAGEKDVPSAVFRYTEEKLALFLNRLFTCDGSIYIQNGKQGAISYSTISQPLARSVQHLLLRFGILSKLRHREIKYRDDVRPAFEIRITDAPSLQQFVDSIGAFGKEEAVDTLRTALQSTARNSNLDVIPLPIWKRILEIKGDRSWRSIYRAIGVSQDSNFHVGKRAPSRRRLGQIADALDSDELRDLAASDVYWDRIVSIDYLGERQVYDLTVPDTHNFVADDFIVHNTSFALSVIEKAALNLNSRIAVFSLEMSSEQLVQRLLSMKAKVDSHRLRLGNVYEDEWPILLEVANDLSNSNIYIDDTPGATINEIRTKARRLYAEHGLDLLIIDYMQLMSGSSGGGNENRQQEISLISRSLKGLARELNIPVIALSQLSRAVEGRADKRPMLSDLRESGSIEQDADAVMFLYREDYYIEDTDRQNIADVIVAKHRHGSTGTVSLYFRKELTQFSDMEVQRTDLDY